MNEVLLRMRSRKIDKQLPSRHLHLTKILEALTSSGLNTTPSTDPAIMGNITIRFAKNGEAMRKVVRRANYRMTGKFPSELNGEMVHWESMYELWSFQMLEITPSVRSYKAQPAEISYSGMDGVRHLHYPDILVELNRSATWASMANISY